MRSILTDLAKQQIRQTAKYIRKEFGKRSRDEFMQEIRRPRGRSKVAAHEFDIPSSFRT